MVQRFLNLWGCFLVIGIFGGCSGPSTESSPPLKTITLATTTSTQDSGLLDVLCPAFEKNSGIKVRVIAVGSGQALELGRRGDADVLLTHSPEAEKKFMEEGWGERRLPVMHNDFVILGPADDPATIRKVPTAAKAFNQIASTQSPFISRGDDSGTHQKEKSVWKDLGMVPEGKWYVRGGVGMAQALRMAQEKKAYLLCDRGTYLALKQELDLVVLLEGDERLLNRYSVIPVHPGKHPHIQRQEANRFADFLVSPEGQQAIGTFGVERFGQPLFIPHEANALRQ